MTAHRVDPTWLEAVRMTAWQFAQDRELDQQRRRIALRAAWKARDAKRARRRKAGKRSKAAQ